MPEGDILHHHARVLAPRLVGHSITRVTTQGLERDLAGRAITAVVAHGKHLVIDLDDGTRVRTHLGMNGSIRAYEPAEADRLLARSSPGHARLVIATDTVTVVWWRAPTVEILSRRAPMRDVALARLGPDVLEPDFDPEDAATRASAADHATPTIVAEMLLDQRVVSGIGNIYKNETLWTRRIHPATRVARLDRAILAELYAIAHDLMSRRDRTRHVYNRTGEPCERCETRIVRAELAGRTSWWCPVCQLVSATSGPVPGTETGADR